MIDMLGRIKRAIKPLVVAAIALAIAGLIGGVVLLVSGIVPIKASSGHWAITAALLDFAKRRSVNTYTLGMTVPPLEDRALILKGAGHYAFGCEPCHGSPVLQQPRIAAAMTPKPPELRTAALTFDPEELFYIVKHGIKFTGMPAWPALERDDEVWAVVAFLRTLPTLERSGYLELTGTAGTAPDDQPLEGLTGSSGSMPDAVGQSCARCHGTDGLGRGSGAFPKLAGQPIEYLSGSLLAYARGDRHSGVMEPLAARLGADDIRTIAEYYGSLPAPGPPGAGSDQQLVSLGQRIAYEGIPDRQIPACRECHGPSTPRNPNYPRLAGQSARYTELQLSLFQRQQRGGTPYHEIMQKFAGQLTDEHIRAVAQFYASLPGER